MRRMFSKLLPACLAGLVASSAAAVEPEVYVERVKPRLANLTCPGSSTGLLAWTDATFPDEDAAKEPVGAWTVLLDLKDGRPARVRIRVYLRMAEPRQAVLWSGTFDAAGRLATETPESEKGLRNNVALGLEVLRRFCSRGRPTDEIARTVADNRRRIGWPWPKMQTD